jgi:DNA-directed RNA polymerase specialized sigma24 family protein
MLCVVPRGLGERLVERVDRSLAAEGVRVVVERRAGDERRAAERRTQALPRNRIVERRHVHAADGRRIAERRAAVVPVEPPPLPRRVRQHAARLRFVTPLVDPPEVLADVAAARAVVRRQLGDATAGRELFADWFDRAYAFAHVALGRSAPAEDAVQDAFCTALSRAATLDPLATPFRVVLFGGLVEAVHAREGTGAPAEDAPTPSADARASLRLVADRELVLLAGRLPVAERDALLLRHVGGLGLLQIAALTGVDLAGAGRTQRAAHDRLLDAVAAHSGGVGEARRETMLRREAPSTVLRARRLALRPA